MNFFNTKSPPQNNYYDSLHTPARNDNISSAYQDYKETNFEIQGSIDFNKKNDDDNDTLGMKKIFFPLILLLQELSLSHDTFDKDHKFWVEESNLVGSISRHFFSKIKEYSSYKYKLSTNDKPVFQNIYSVLFLILDFIIGLIYLFLVLIETFFNLVEFGVKRLFLLFRILGSFIATFLDFVVRFVLIFFILLSAFYFLISIVEPLNGLQDFLDRLLNKIIEFNLGEFIGTIIREIAQSLTATSS